MRRCAVCCCGPGRPCSYAPGTTAPHSTASTRLLLLQLQRPAPLLRLLQRRLRLRQPPLRAPQLLFHLRRRVLRLLRAALRGASLILGLALRRHGRLAALRDGMQ